MCQISALVRWRSGTAVAFKSACHGENPLGDSLRVRWSKIKAEAAARVGRPGLSDGVTFSKKEPVRIPQLQLQKEKLQ